MEFNYIWVATSRHSEPTRCNAAMIVTTAQHSMVMAVKKTLKLLEREPFRFPEPRILNATHIGTLAA